MHGSDIQKNGWSLLATFVVALAVAGCSEPWITGKVVPIPASFLAEKGTIVVRKGDTVHGIARRYGAGIRSLIDANGLSPPYLLRIGQKLKLPVRRTYRVKKGDTVYGISRRFGIDMRDLVRWNGIHRPYTITVGEKLHLPDKIGRSKTITSAKTPHRSAVSSRTTKVPPRGKRNFLKPVQGKVLSAFGPKSDGLHNDGINIAAAKGAPVRAAENGVVVYVGTEFHSFGNLLLIKHADGWVSAYGHTDKPLVKRGDVVKRGELVAKVGKSGNVNAPQLHFELRRGTRAVDPTRYLTAT